MHFEVPQFIEIEDKIIGPFTWKQFLYLGGGAGIIVILYLSAPFLVFALVGIPVAALFGSLAFHKVNNRPFSFFLEACLNYFTKKRLYLWRREHEQEIIVRSSPQELSLPGKPASSLGALRETLKSLDS